mmetsp:Transcript_101557/g.276044  ORF Transcript_101557/g.276044 Transcript_101557/m.276044 type:complete len:273 (+) Transcript_101557:229-1047(+)
MGPRGLSPGAGSHSVSSASVAVGPVVLHRRPPEVLARTGREFLELHRDFLAGPVQHLHERSGEFRIPLCEERHGEARLARAPAPPDAVDVGLDIVRGVVVNDEFHLRDVVTAAEDVGAHEATAIAVAELLEHPHALLLRLVGMYPERLDLAGFELDNQLVHNRFRPAEDEALLRAPLLVAPAPNYCFSQLVELVHVLAEDQHGLLNRPARRQPIAAHTHGHRSKAAVCAGVGAVLGSEVLHLLGPGGREHEHLAVGPHLAQDESDLAAEALA